MTGYIKAFKPELKIKDYEIYKGVYCSVCRALGRLYSPLAQLLLSFDFTFLSLLRMAVEPQCPSFTEGRCCYNPAKKCLKCSDTAEIERSADIVILISYYKLRDDIEDSGFFKSMLLRLLIPVAKLMHRKAALRQPFLNAAIKAAMEEQSRLERSGDVSLDIAADPSAKALAAVFSQGHYGDDKQLLWRLGYMLGRWVYLVDAADDLKDDIKSGSFNPFKAKFPTRESAESKEFSDYAAGILNMTAGEVAAVFENLTFYRFKDIIENVIYDGIYSVQNNILHRGCEE